jgi:DNA (cytosine-5)-methyltransferase 1
MKSANPGSGFYEAVTSRTLDTCGGNPVCNQGGMVIINEAVGVHQNQSGELNTTDTAYSLATSCNASARNAPLVAHPRVSGTLLSSGAGLSRTVGLASETDFCVAYALAGNMIGRRERNGPSGSGVSENLAFTLTAMDTPGVAAVDCRNFCETAERSGTLQANGSQGYSLNCQNPIRAGYIVRRLTPTECERLQGFPDGWTAYGRDGEEISDTRRYQMLGNSVAIPCVAFVLGNIAAQIRGDV